MNVKKNKLLPVERKYAMPNVQDRLKNVNVC